MKSPFELLIDVAASKRLTRLIVKDEITRPLREHPEVEKHEKLSYLLNCPYCVSIYTSAAVTVAGIVFPKASKPLIYALALAEAQAQLHELDEQRAALAEDYGSAL